MVIQPLPVFEADADPHHRNAMSDEETYASLEPPKTIVVRFGAMKMIGEYPYEGDAKPGCGTKLVVRTHRGTELGHMLTTTCENAGCSKSITRKEMLSFIENYDVKSVAMTDGIIGCPHEEGADYEGPTCPTCPFWANRDRWTGEVVH